MYFHTSPLLECVLCSPPVGGLPSRSLGSAFHRAEVFNFKEVQLINFFFMDHAFALSKKSSTNSRSSRFSLTLTSRSFIILHLGL